MYKTLLQNKSKLSSAQSGASFLLHKAEQYLGGFLTELDKQIDHRLVRTFFDLFMVIQTFRNRAMGLVLSELGGYICGPAHAPAGTKRISNLLRCKNWDWQMVDDFLFSKASQRIKELQEKGKRVLFLWDDSQLEKPESWFSEGLCSVGSSKGKRLTKIKRGFYKPPSSRICVPGFQWSAILVSAINEVPSLCHMSWWTTRGKYKEWAGNIMFRMLEKCSQHFGRLAVHILDRGYASEQVLDRLFEFEQDFIIRWKKNHNLINTKGELKKTYLISRSCKAQGSRLVWDKERKIYKRITIAYTPVYHPQFTDKPLFLVIVRDKHHHASPMYLLTSLSVNNTQQAWEICFSYFHRWNIEQAFRFGKSELAMESPRLWWFENRLKFLAIVSLVYDFLISLMRNWRGWVQQFLRNWCHRTGNRYRDATIPIYRLRSAIALCLFFFLAQNSG